MGTTPKITCYFCYYSAVFTIKFCLMYVSMYILCTIQLHVLTSPHLFLMCCRNLSCYSDVTLSLCNILEHTELVFMCWLFQCMLRCVCHNFCWLFLSSVRAVVLFVREHRYWTANLKFFLCEHFRLILTPLHTLSLFHASPTLWQLTILVE